MPQFRFVYLSFIAALLTLVTATMPARGQFFDERFEDWPLQTTLSGSIVVAEKLADLAVVPDNVRASMGLKVDVIGSFDADELDSAGLSVATSFAAGDARPTGEGRPLLIPASVLLSYSTKDSTGDSDEVAAEAVWASKIADAQIDEGGVLLLVGEMNTTDAATSKRYPLPDCRIQTGYQPADGRSALIKQIREIPRSVGVGLPSGCVLILSGRKVMCFGKTANFIIASKQYEDTVETQLRERASGEAIESWLVDLTQLRRRAIDHELEPFPAARPSAPAVPRGTLMIVGGGGMPKDLMRDFVKEAGGEKAKLIYVPCSESDEVPARPSIVQQWLSMGVASAAVLHTKDRTQANNDSNFYSPLKDATGIWYGGGRQWNFADSYYGTTSHRMMKEVLDRGGVIGGSSAGASIQARYLARATPIQNFDIMAPGYERGGLGFVSGVAIDQHFSQRKRHDDMKQLVAKYPQLLGIGIDEATAITVRGSEAKVRGEGKVFFFDQDRIIGLPAGRTYDLASRKEIDPNKVDDASEAVDVK